MHVMGSRRYVLSAMERSWLTAGLAGQLATDPTSAAWLVHAGTRRCEGERVGGGWWRCKGSSECDGIAQTYAH